MEESTSWLSQVVHGVHLLATVGVTAAGFIKVCSRNSLQQNSNMTSCNRESDTHTTFAIFCLFEGSHRSENTQGLNLGLLHCRQIFFTIWSTRESQDPSLPPPRFWWLLEILGIPWLVDALLHLCLCCHLAFFLCLFSYEDIGHWIEGSLYYGMT